jgi:hypothetical protein
VVDDNLTLKKKPLIQEENINVKFSQIRWLKVKANPKDDCGILNNSITRGSFDN